MNGRAGRTSTPYSTPRASELLVIVDGPTQTPARREPSGVRHGLPDPLLSRPVAVPRRRALSQVGGPTRVRGDAAVAERLRTAFEAAEREPDDALTHGFHAYPARMHRAIARALVASFGRVDASLLDPFCGSGTTLVEAMVAGMRSTGIDLNPVALRIAEQKCALRDTAARERFAERLAAVTEASLRRVRARAPALAPLDAAERRFYDPHVLRELAGLHHEIDAVRPEADRRALALLLSAIVVKFSRQRADTSEQTIEKRIGRGVPTRFFARKGEELLERWAALALACAEAPAVHAPRLLLDDARNVADRLSGTRVDLVVSSPPYGGTYDYTGHHARRYPWLGVSPTRLRAGEIGARRHLGRDSGDAASSRWDAELLAVLRSLAGVMTETTIAVWLIGDAQLGRVRVPADVQMQSLLPKAGLRPIAFASQPRRDARGGPERHEHLIAFGRIHR